MKYLFILLLFISSCTPVIDTPIIEAPPIESSETKYVGYPLYSLQTNENGTYRLAYWLNEETIQVFAQIPMNNLTIERGKSQNVAFVQLINNQPSGMYIIYLQNDYTISQFFN